MEILLSRVLMIRNNLWQINHFLISLHLVTFLLFLLYFLHKKLSSGSNTTKLLPPSPPKLPLIGNIHQLGKNLHRSLKTLSDKYGPLMLLNLGQVPILVVSSPAIVQEIFEKHDVAFSSRPKTTASEILFYGNNNILFAPLGEYWKQARKVCVVELLSHKRVQSFRSVREEEAEALLNRIRKACPNYRDNGASINISEMLIQASNNVMSRCILGHSYKEEDGSIKKLGDLSNEMAKNLMAFSVGDLFPSLRWIDVLRGFIGRLRTSFRAFDDFNDRVIEEHKAAQKLLDDHDHDGSRTEDFVDVLLRIQRDTRPDFEFTDDNLKAILQDMLAAGNDSSSTSLEWLMAELVKNPRVMKKAQEEIRRVVGKKANIETEDINRMSFLKCVVKENLRLHPPAPLLAPRETIAKVAIRGYEIPAQTRVLVNAWAIQRDPGLWDRPEEFVPERFENNLVDFNGQDFRYFPFGFGRRRCPGLSFSLVTIEFLIANVLYWFDWKLPDDYGIMSHGDLDMSEIYGISVRKKVPLRVVAVPYNP